MASQLFVAGEDVHFDYATAPESSSQSKKKNKKKNKKKKANNNNNASSTITEEINPNWTKSDGHNYKLEVELNDETSEYPSSRVLKLDANGDLIVSEYKSDEEDDSARFEKYEDDDNDHDNLNGALTSDNHLEYNHNHNHSHSHNNHNHNNHSHNHSHSHNHNHSHNQDGLDRKGHYADSLKEFLKSEAQKEDPNDINCSHCTDLDHSDPSLDAEAYRKYYYNNQLADSDNIGRSVFESLWDDITSEDEKIKIEQFWNRLPAEKKKAIITVDKDEILKCLRDEQNSGCNCKVCGNKKISVESEIEKVYDEYYATFLKPITKDFQESGDDRWAKTLKDFLDALLGFGTFTDHQAKHQNRLLSSLQTGFNYQLGAQAKALRSQNQNSLQHQQHQQHQQPSQSQLQAQLQANVPQNNVNDHTLEAPIGEFDPNNDFSVESFAKGLLGPDSKNFMSAMLKTLDKRRNDRDQTDNSVNLHNFPGSFVEDNDESGCDHGHDHDHDHHDHHGHSHSHNHSHSHSNHGHGHNHGRHSHSHSHSHHDQDHGSESDYQSDLGLEDADEYEEEYEEEYDDDDDHEGVEEYDDNDDDDDDVDDNDDDDDDDQDEYRDVEDDEYSNDDDDEEEEYMDYDDEDEIDEEKEERGRISETFRMLQLVSSKVLHAKLMKAYKAQVAEESSQQLLEELEKEEQRKKEKQEREREKREKNKEKKRLQRLAKEEEKKRKEEEKKEHERLMKEELARKTEEGRKKKEAERKKREEEKQKKIEAERKKKEAEQERLRKEKEKKEQKKLEEKLRREEEKKRREEEQYKKEQAKLEKKKQLETEALSNGTSNVENLKNLQTDPVSKSPSNSPLPTQIDNIPPEVHQLLSSGANSVLESFAQPPLQQQQQPSNTSADSALTEDQLSRLLQSFGSLNVQSPQPASQILHPQSQQQAPPQSQPQQQNSVVPPPPGFNPASIPDALNFNGINLNTNANTATNPSIASNWNFDSSTINSKFNTGLPNGSATNDPAIGPTSNLFSAFGAQPAQAQPQQRGSVGAADIHLLSQFLPDTNGTPNFGAPQSQGSSLGFATQHRKSIGVFNNSHGGSSLLQQSSFFNNELDVGIGGVLSDSKIWGTGDTSNKSIETNGSTWGKSPAKEGSTPMSNGVNQIGLSGSSSSSHLGAGTQLPNNSLWFSPQNGISNVNLPINPSNSIGVGSLSSANTLLNSFPTTSASTNGEFMDSGSSDAEKIQLEVLKVKGNVPSENSTDYSTSLLYHQARRSLIANGDKRGESLTLDQFTNSLCVRLAGKLGVSFEIIYDKMGSPSHTKIIKTSLSTSNNGLNGFDTQRLGGFNPDLINQGSVTGAGLLPFNTTSANGLDNWVSSGFRSS